MIGDHENPHLTEDQLRRHSHVAVDGPLVLVAFVFSAALVFALIAALLMWALK